MKKSVLGIILLTFVAGVACTSKVKKLEKESAVIKLNDDQRMAWWRDAHLGMFIHWGAYAVPGGERNGKVCGGGAEWIMDKLDYTIEDYEKEVVDQFNPVNFDADAWVRIAKDAGMKYIVLTSKHHDGFCMWDSKVSDYTVVKRTEFGRDVIEELAEACKKQDIVFCFYYSITDWHHPEAQSIFYPHYNVGQKDQTKSNPDFPKYYENYLKPQIKELLTSYGDVGVVWFDGEWIADYTTEMGKDLYKTIREIQPNTIVNNRVDKGRNGMKGINVEGSYAGDFGTPEKEVPATGIDSDWEACFTMNGSWGYKPSDINWKSDTMLIQSFVDIVSKGGNFLLNVGPDETGLFPQQSIDILASMGKWNKVNGEAVYGAKASPVDRPEWGRYTSKEGVVYAHIFDWPENGKLQIDEQLNVKKATLLADANKELEVDASTIYLPESAPDGIVTVVKLKLVAE
jgi:alpha-L-fucosidase